jgi:uncharacterized delta-60 repeat protein
MNTQTSLNRNCDIVVSKQALWAFALIMTGLLVSFFLSTRAEAAPGDLDQTFGSGGKVTTAILGGGQGLAAAVQPDGKIVVAGLANGDFAVARYNRDGSLDSLFGIGGRVTTDFFNDFDQAEALALQSDGKIVIAGLAFDPHSGTVNDIALVRYNRDGTLDISFGNGGKVITDFFGEDDIAHAVAIQRNGKILVAGGASKLDEGGHVALVRYNRDGTLDISFGNGGKVTTDFATPDVLGSLDAARAIVLQPDGKIVVAGERNEVTLSNTGEPVFALDFALARYNKNGSLDTFFGTGGKVITDFFGSDDIAFAVALQPNGKIVVAGGTELQSPDGDFALARYTRNGRLDNDFGTEGKVTTDFFGGEDAAKGVAIQPGGRIVVAGFATGVSTGLDFSLARYKRDGSLDNTGFGTEGKVTTDFFGGDDQATALIFQPGGKFVAAGFALNTHTLNFNFALARYFSRSPEHHNPEHY